MLFPLFLLSRRSLTDRSRFILRSLSTQAAARRIAYYWKCRREFFGDRAFLHMTLAGAMAEDLETLEKGLISVSTLHPISTVEVFYTDIELK
jgi:hypothetical protein